MIFGKRLLRAGDSSVPAEKAQPSIEPPLPDAWPSEAAVQAVLVRALGAQGWRIERTANTRTGERGIDVVASRRKERLQVEVKGYPGTTYARGPKAGQPKPTQPSLQGSHYFDGGIRKCLQMREQDAQARVVLALPDIPRFRTLTASVAGSLRATRVEVWFVSENGALSA